MDQNRLTVVPFLLAMFAAVAAMPLNIYQICAWNAGTLEIEPWRQKTSAALRSVGSRLAAWFARLWSPRVAFACAAMLFALLMAHSAGAEHGYIMAVLPVGLSLPELREAKGRLAAEAAQVLTDGETRTGGWTDADEQKFNTIHADIEEASKRIARFERNEAVAATLADTQGRRSDPVPPSQRSANNNQQQGTRTGSAKPEDHALALLGWFMGGSNRRTDAMNQAAARTGINVEDKTLHLGLAARPPASSREQDMQEWEQRYLGVDIVSPDLGGHYLVPNETMRALETALLAFGGMRSVATVLRTDTGANLPFPTINDTANEGAIIGEGDEETNEVLPSIGQLVLEAFTYTSKKIPVSIEFMQDNAINFAARVGELLGDRIARIGNRHFTVGTGSGQPKGIVTAATSSGVTALSATAFSYDNIVDLTHSVDPAYRNNGAKFMFHDNVLKALKKIKVPQYSGDTAGQPLWRPGLTVGAPDTIDGYGYVINQHMPLPTTGQKAMIFGALNKYQIRDVRTVEVMRLNELRAEFRQVLWLAFSRHDGDLLDAGTHPVKYITMA